MDQTNDVTFCKPCANKNIHELSLDEHKIENGEEKVLTETTEDFCCSTSLLNCSMETETFRTLLTNVTKETIDLYCSNKHFELFDSHCHLQLSPEENIESIIQKCYPTINYISVCGVCPGDDWMKIENLYKQYSLFIIPHFGLHPWYIKEYQTRKISINNLNLNWDTELMNMLTKYPMAGVGECGLDKYIKKDVDVSSQELILKSHFQIAHDCNRVITIHCVGLWQNLVNIIFNKSKRLNYQPKYIVLHSCNSMPVQIFDKLKDVEIIYFSISYSSNIISDKFSYLLRKIPISRILIESDSPDQIPSILRISNEISLDSKRRLNIPNNIVYTCYILSHIIGLSFEELASITTANARRVFLSPKVV